MRILSGIQPSGALHLGNYFGMMRPAIELQEQGEAYYFIANYHSMTSLFDADQRRKNTLVSLFAKTQRDRTHRILHFALHPIDEPPHPTPTRTARVCHASQR